MSSKLEKKVIFQRFSSKAEGRLFPYPPLYREPDTDYICFTNEERVRSSVWKMRVMTLQGEDLETADLEPYLKEYDVRCELKPQQIQIDSLFSAISEEEKIVTVPELRELPLVQFVPEKVIPTADTKGQYIYRKNSIYTGGKYDGRPLLLTIGVPVSNQIETIDRCLSHIKPLLDQLDAELLVIDTGSTDGTVEVCRKYGARILCYPWCENMSVVRNEGIYNARGEWYMSIDDDEWFEDVEEILAFFQSGIYRNYDKASYIQRNYADAAGTGYEDCHTVRMAKITPELHFEGRIHDALCMEPMYNRACLLNSYVHHYGFVMDDAEKTRKKFQRNAPILMQDVYEYPWNLRYLFQLANEYRCIERFDVAVGLFAKTIAMACELNATNEGKNSIVMLIACLYEMYDKRLFSWGRTVESLFPLSASEQAFIAWCQESISYQVGQPPERILEYYQRYKEGLHLYRQDPVAEQYRTFYGLAAVEQELYIMDAHAMAFCAYLAAGAEEEAQELLSSVSIDMVKDRRGAMLAAGLNAGDRVYDMLCGQLELWQWEAWSGEILEAFFFGIAGDSAYSRQKKRIPDMLSRFSISDIISWYERLGEKRGETERKRLCEYAMECNMESASVQELCFSAWVLKEAYVKNRERENAGELLRCYLFVLMTFAKHYYNLELLTDPDCRVIPPDIRAAYRMAAVLIDGRASHENVTVLKQALAIFPPFHEEIRSILMELGTNG